MRSVTPAALRCDSLPVSFPRVFQGTVVPRAQTEKMAGMSNNDVRWRCIASAKEGHGFRSGPRQVEVLEGTEAFFRRTLAL